MTIERKNFHRSNFEIKELTDNKDFVGEFKGYAVIYEEKDHGTWCSEADIIHKGAFAKQLEEWKTSPSATKALIDHCSYDLGAVYTAIYEDNKGLIVEGKFLNTSKGRDLYIEVKTGAKDSLSIGFIINEFKMDDSNVRHIFSFKSVDEISFVTWGSQPNAKVEAKTIRDFEKQLKDLGYTNREAKAIASKGFNALGRDDEAVQWDAETESKLDDLINCLRKD